MKVGFIGLGKMGFPMATNLLAAGHRVTVYNRTKSRADELAARGAIVAGTPEACAGRSEEHTSELQSQSNLVCRLLLEKKKKTETTSPKPAETSNRCTNRSPQHESAVFISWSGSAKRRRNINHTAVRKDDTSTRRTSLASIV